MYERMLRRLCEKIRTRQYVMTLHAVDEMEDDGLTIFDVEKTILSGKIVERQKDNVTGEWKYLIKSQAIIDLEIVVVTKLSPTGRLGIITVYVE